MKLSLGPVLFDWSREELLSFYKEAASWPVSDVYIGEVVCHRKKGLSIDDIARIGDELKKAGKNVIISTLALVSDDIELARVREMCALPFPIEANDVSVIQILQGKKDIVAGPHITSYNSETVRFLKRVGVKRVVFPVEISRGSMESISRSVDIETEAFVYGKLPLAFSWRCYTSRYFGQIKSSCKFDCRKYPDGMMVETLEKRPLFIINGTQIMSAQTMNLIEFIDDLKDMGISKARISPQHRTTGDVIKVFSERLKGAVSVDEAKERLLKMEKVGFCNGWYHGKAGWEELQAATGFQPALVE